MNHIVKKWLTICLLCFAASVVSYAQIGEAWYMRSYAQNSWTSISGNILNFGQYSFVTGNNMTGVIVCGGPTNRSMMYSLNYTGQWLNIVEPPSQVFGLAGDTVNGAVIYTADNNQETIYYINNFSLNAWSSVSVYAPWPIQGIAGNNAKGPVIFGGPSNLDVAYMNSYATPQWNVIGAKPPFSLAGICGNNTTGIVGFGGPNRNQVAYITTWSNTNWTTIANAPISITYISGDTVNGVNIVGGVSGQECWHINNFASGQWLQDAGTPITPTSLGGENYYGPVIVGNIP